MLVVGLEDIESRFSQSLARANEFHNIGTLCRRNLRSGQAGDAWFLFRGVLRFCSIVDC